MRSIRVEHGLERGAVVRRLPQPRRCKADVEHARIAGYHRDVVDTAALPDRIDLAEAEVHEEWVVGAVEDLLLLLSGTLRMQRHSERERQRSCAGPTPARLHRCYSWGKEGHRAGARQD